MTLRTSVWGLGRLQGRDILSLTRKDPLTDRQREAVTTVLLLRVGPELLNKSVTSIQPKIMELIKFNGARTAYHTGRVQRKCELTWKGGVQTLMLCTKSILLQCL